MADITPGAAPARTGDGANERAQALKAKAEAVRDWAEERADQARSWASDIAGKVRGMIAEEPVKVVTVSTIAAFVAGALLGLVVARLSME